MISNYSNKENFELKHTRICIICGEKYNVPPYSNNKTCSVKCAGSLSSERMIDNNPMNREDVRDKMSRTLRLMKHKPKIIGGNGRELSKPHQTLFNALCSSIEDLKCEYIQANGPYRMLYNIPNHYKIDIASYKNKIAIEVDGLSHNSLKIKECDRKKEMILGMFGWRVLRFTNKEVMENTTECVQKVLSMI